jgi:uncharacterized membrane protein YidH (DUF202 family)
MSGALTFRFGESDAQAPLPNVLPLVSTAASAERGSGRHGRHHHRQCLSPWCNLQPNAWQMRLYFCTVTILTVACIFLSSIFPAYNAETYNEPDSQIDRTLHSRPFYVSVVVSVTMTINMLIEVLLNLSSGVRRGTYGPIMVLIPLLLLYDFVIVFNVIPKADVQLFWCCLNVRDYIMGVSFIMYLMNYGEPTWLRSASLHFAFLLASITMLAQQYSLHMMGPSNMLSTLSIASAATNACAGMVNCVSYIKHIQQKSVLQAHEICAAMYGGLIVFAPVAVVVFYFIFGDEAVNDLSVAYMTSYTYAFQALIVTIYIAHSRLQVLETAAKDKAVIVIKNNFVRYVSHEVSRAVYRATILYTNLFIFFALVRSCSCCSCCTLVKSSR